MSIAEKELYTLSAKSTIDTIFALEPNIVEVDNDTLYLYNKVINMEKKQTCVISLLNEKI